MKNYVLDTTVLLYDPQALFRFEENNVIIPISSIEVIDHFKKDMNETGRNARQASRYLDSMRKRGSLANGVPLDTGGRLCIQSDTGNALAHVLRVFHERSRDNVTLAIALELKRSASLPTIFVTKDISLRIKADALGLVVEDYQSDKVDIEELYPGWRRIDCDGTTIDEFNSRGSVAAPNDLLPNQYVNFVDRVDEHHAALGRFDAAHHKIVRLLQPGRGDQGRILGRNAEQCFALDALVNDQIELVTLVGKAGTGKTLLAVAMAIFKTVDENIYSRILVSRPTLPMGKDIGFLPGTIEEKLTPWMYPIADNVELIMRNEARGRRPIRGFRELVDMGILVIEPLTYIRGRSIHNQFLIVDEAQNLTPHEIKTIITRVGEGTKIVLTGDPYQIDNPYIDSSSNGLAYVVEKFKGQDLAGHITLQKGERSKLSALAANLL
jgi:PhoH-like ATPase